MQNNIFSSHSAQQDILVIDKTDSTNTYLKYYLSNFKPLEEFTAIMAREQTDGKGLRGNRWESQKGKNLTFSLLLYPTFIPIRSQFLLSACISISMYELLKNYVENVKIKWPNDLYINHHKIGGILIENSLSSDKIKHSIVGIGININQIKFDKSLTNKATSLSLITQRNDYDLLLLCKELIDLIKKNYSHLKSNENNYLLETYNRHLLYKDAKRPFIIDNQIVEGVIKGVEEDGLLKIEVNNHITKYDLKEIIYHL